MPMTSQEMIKLLLKKRFCYYQPERLPCYHCKDIKKGLEQAILKQAGLK